MVLLTGVQNLMNKSHIAHISFVQPAVSGIGKKHFVLFLLEKRKQWVVCCFLSPPLSVECKNNKFKPSYHFNF